MTPTAEQQAIIQAALSEKDSIMVHAYAGCTKSSTLRMVANALPPGQGLALAFNVKTRDALQKQFPNWFKVQTLNGLGHVAWGKAIGLMPKVDERKLSSLIKEHGTTQEDYEAVRELITEAMLAGLVPSVFPHQGLVPDSEESWTDLTETPALWRDARAILIASIKAAFAGTISFDDQIYMSAMFNGVFPRYPLVLGDEVQDFSILNHIQVRRSASDRLIIVGDELQSIYAFRGADSDSMRNIRKLRAKWIDLPLTTTFRCPRLIVERQQGHAPGFNAALGNMPGRFLALGPWSWPDITNAAHGGSVAVICRNNAPLLALCFKLIRQGVSATILGRNIGRGLIALTKRILPMDTLPRAECERLIKQWAQVQIDETKSERKKTAIEDKAECLLMVLETCPDAKALRKALETIFQNTSGQVELTTAHRAKGLEWDTVIHLDPFRVPSKKATSVHAIQQERNIAYVTDTRTRDLLVEANLAGFT